MVHAPDYGEKVQVSQVFGIGYWESQDIQFVTLRVCRFSKNMTHSQNSCPRVVPWDNSVRTVGCVAGGSRPSTGSVARMVRVSAEPGARVGLRYRSRLGEVVDSTLDRVTIESLASALPIREFRSYKGRVHYSGWYWSSTVGTWSRMRAGWSWPGWCLPTLIRRVAAVVAQPFQLIGSDGTRTRRHVPDFLLVNSDNLVTVVDVEAPSKRGDPAVRGLMEWTRETVDLRGWEFEEWYGAEPTLLANVTFLAGYRRRRTISEVLIPDVIARCVQEAPIMSVEQSLLPVHPALVRPVILHLLWTGDLVTDLDRPLGADSVVHAAANAAVHADVHADVPVGVPSVEPEVSS